jgi:hypothetical protein
MDFGEGPAVMNHTCRSPVYLVLSKSIPQSKELETEHGGMKFIFAVLDTWNARNLITDVPSVSITPQSDRVFRSPRWRHYFTPSTDLA